MAFKALKSIEYEVVDKAATAYFPPILDKEAYIAAESLTIDDGVVAANALKAVYNAIALDEEPPYPYPYLKNAVMFSYSNFMWFATFFQKLQKLYSLPGFEIPYDKAPKPSKPTDIHIYPPFYVVEINGKFKIMYEEISLPLPVLLNKHRASYILKGHELEEFRCGFPKWYLIRSTTIFENYSVKTNKRVKVVLNGGEFRYYIAGASDNWQEVLDVPLEIDDVIAALLFRS